MHFQRKPITRQLAGSQCTFKRPDAMTQLQWLQRMEGALAEDRSFRPDAEALQGFAADLAALLTHINGEPVDLPASYLIESLSYSEICTAWTGIWQECQVSEAERDLSDPQSSPNQT